MYLLIVMLLVTLGFVHGYRAFITRANERVECTDLMNKRLFSIRFDICLWNLLHIATFFVLCLFIRPTSITSYITIFIFGMIWFWVERACSTKTREMKCSHEIVYSNITAPRYDDMVYNCVGILMYVCYISLL